MEVPIADPFAYRTLRYSRVSVRHYEPNDLPYAADAAHPIELEQV